MHCFAIPPHFQTHPCHQSLFWLTDTNSTWNIVALRGFCFLVTVATLWWGPFVSTNYSSKVSTNQAGGIKTKWGYHTKKETWWDIKKPTITYWQNMICVYIYICTHKNMDTWKPVDGSKFQSTWLLHKWMRYQGPTDLVEMAMDKQVKQILV